MNIVLNHKVIIILALIIGPLNVVSSETDDPYRTIVWKERPISVSMRTGDEKILSFSEDVQWSLPKDLIGLVEGESIAGQVFITSDTEFDKGRFRFRGLDTNTFYILDISSSARGDKTPLKIVSADVLSSSNISSKPVPSNRRVTGIPQLSRFAFQSVYAPDRLVNVPWDVVSVRIRDREPKFHMVPGYRIQVKPIAQWKNENGRYAVALEMTNLEPRTVKIDPRRLRSEDTWRSFSTITDTLGPNGTKTDKTVVVLISSGSWGEVSSWLR